MIAIVPLTTIDMYPGGYYDAAAGNQIEAIGCWQAVIDNDERTRVILTEISMMYLSREGGVDVGSNAGRKDEN